MENLKNTEFGQDANLRAKKKLTNRTDVLDKAHLSPDDKAKTKALLDLHKAIQESEDNEEGGSDPPPRYIRPLCSERSKLRNINAVLDAFCEACMSKRQRKSSWENNQRG
ncbi:unnamed protein product [Porites lobata]|uniref:Uncharacterized protein n=1 Tax=Porites lobata TaxID=104759 RepID=A0ABN8MVM4_9CNID|nr:unnamed protein product [Porites lobata]CAH3171128.1 unnamed protein product [Porites lobata]CAH3189106.1 unnamed protein product [Porites lobata]